MTARLAAKVALGGGLGNPWFTNNPERDCDLDRDRAATELRQAGYTVFRSPPGLRAPETAVLRVIEETAPRETSTDRIERVLNALIQHRRKPDDHAAH